MFVALKVRVCSSESKDESDPVEDDCKDKGAKEEDQGEECDPGEHQPRNFHSPERGTRLLIPSDSVLLSHCHNKQYFKTF